MEPKVPVVVPVASDVKQEKTKATRVVRLKRSNGQIVQNCDVYIGRKLTMGGWNLPDSKWHNPYPVDVCPGGLTEALKNFELYLRTRKDLLQAISTELKGRVLGCWCSPKGCHGDLLKRLADGPQSVLDDLVANVPNAKPAPPIPPKPATKKRKKLS